MKAKFTPGPWLVQPGFLTVYTMSNGESGTTNAVASVCQESTSSGSSQTREDAEANANLIAAAPELYEALAELREWYTDIMGMPAHKANAALAKANG